MSAQQTNTPESKRWRMLFIYNGYRLLSIFLFLGIYLYNTPQQHAEFFFAVLFVYFFCSLFFIYGTHQKLLAYDKQVLISGTLDIIAISTMLALIGNTESGYGILLNITIAVLSILIPGRLAIFFAALASCLLLCSSVLQFVLSSPKDLGTFYYSGIYGAGFFATALTAWYLAHWVQLSENLARRRSNELASMQRINEYIVERLHSGIIYIDNDQQIKLINSAARQFFNVSAHAQPEKLHQLSIVLSRKVGDFLTKSKNKQYAAQAILKDPYLRVHFFSTDETNNAEILIILDDMTYISQQAQQLKLASLGRFSASIAHELRNPLGAIAHAVQLFGDAGLDDEDKRLKELIINNCQRMNGVIKNVLQLSRRQQSQPQEHELMPLLEQFKNDFCQSNPCELTLKIPTHKHLSVVFDKSQLEQILVILCDNSLVHGRDKAGLVSIKISVKVFSAKTTITVSDLGPGIAPEFRDTVFEPFFTTQRNGTGMGLFIARDLCEINQARLSLIKTKKGCSFAITLNSSTELLI